MIVPSVLKHVITSLNTLCTRFGLCVVFFLACRACLHYKASFICLVVFTPLHLFNSDHSQSWWILGSDWELDRNLGATQTWPSGRKIAAFLEMEIVTFGCEAAGNLICLQLHAFFMFKAISNQMLVSTNSISTGVPEWNGTPVDLRVPPAFKRLEGALSNAFVIHLLIQYCLNLGQPGWICVEFNSRFFKKKT